MGGVVVSSPLELSPAAVAQESVLGKWCGPEGSFISKIIPDEWVGVCNVGTKNAKFYEGCRLHDECYSTWGAAKSECDRALWDRLTAECDSAFHTWVCVSTKGECRLAARGYYEAVVKWGDAPFQQAQQKAQPPQTMQATE